jgi:single-strand DNA-binding protein
MDKDNQKRFTTEVVLQGFRCAMTLLDSRGGGSAGAMVDEYANGADSEPGNGGGRPPSRTSARDVLDDDVPF